MKAEEQERLTIKCTNFLSANEVNNSKRGLDIAKLCGNLGMKAEEEKVVMVNATRIAMKA